MYNIALEILNIFENNKYKAYIVGGFVRDKLLGIDNNDIDIITDAKPNEICNLFNIDLKDNYGSVKLPYKGFTFDVTTFRKEDNYIDGRRPSFIEYTDDISIDLQRRDFTINTILIDKEGNYIDLFDGITDLNNKIIKSVGDPDKKLKEDSLRILRAIRFMCLYDFKLDDNLKKAIIDNKTLISNLSFDRIKQELDIIFSSSNVNLFFDMINELDLYKTLEIEPINRVIPTDNYLSIWAQLNYSNNYNFSNKEQNYINNLKEINDTNNIDSYTVYKYGIEISKEANKIINNKVDIDSIYNNLIIKSRTDIDITYDEILNIVKDKSIINKIYIDLEKQILYNKLINKKESIISYLEGDSIE